MIFESKHIKSDGKVETIKREDGTPFTLQELQEFVGGYIEIINVGNGTLMIVNEEGLIEKLPLNIEASRIASMDIVGDVLITHSSLID